MQKNDLSTRVGEEAASIYRGIFERSATPTAVFTIHGESCLVNRAFYFQLGYDLGESHQTTIQLSDLFCHPNAVQEFTDLVQDRVVLRRWETEVETLDGDCFPVLLSGRVLTYGGEDHYEVTFTNITQQRQIRDSIQREHNRLSSLVDNLSAGLFLVNRRGIITEANTALGNLTHQDPDDLVSKPYQHLFSILISLAADPDVIQHVLREAVQNVMASPEQVLTLKEGHQHLELSLFPVWDQTGQTLGWGGLVQDVTEMREQAAWKMELLSMLAHDLRTPLATLKGHATALLANYHQWGSEMGLEFLKTINRSVDELVRQVDRNLALTRVESGRLGLRPEATKPRDLVSQAIERAAGSIGEIPIEIALPEEAPKLRVDPARAEEALINLLDNAARYNPPEETILIRGQVLQNMYQLSIIDCGPGVPKEKQSKIFEKYVRDESEGEGTGLGLYISRKIIEAHGGRIWVNSPPTGRQQGAEFSFTLPLLPQVLESRSTVEERLGPIETGFERQGAEGKKILIVEDEVDVQALLHTILRQEGYQVDIVSDGPSALDVLQSDQPDLVLLDWMMPGMSGLNVCRNIRRWSDLPIIVVTSKTAQEDLISALDAGADDYVTKPFVSDELLARIRALLRRGTSPRFQAEEADQFRADGLVIDYTTRSVWLHGAPLQLTPTEYKILVFMARHQKQVLTYDQLIDHLWDVAEAQNRHSLFVHISRLREKLEKDPKDPKFIKTQWGVGYVFMPD